MGLLHGAFGDAYQQINKSIMFPLCVLWKNKVKLLTSEIEINSNKFNGLN